MSSEYDDPPPDPPPDRAAGQTPTGDAGPIGEQLLHQAQAIARLRADLDQLAQHSTDTLVDLVERLENLENLENLESSTERAGGTPAAWCWRDLGPHATNELWDQLTGWVGWLRGRYPLARKIPPCWAEHPETVEELTALWLAWQAAYTEPNPALTAAADWHDRWLPGVLYRLEHGPFALDCATGHRARPPTSYATAPKTATATATGTAADQTGAGREPSRALRREQDAHAGPAEKPRDVPCPAPRPVVHHQPTAQPDDAG